MNKIIIIGSGPAGYTAALYAARANLSPILISGIQPGGQLTTTTDVENYPGFETPIQGPWLMEQMKKQCENVGVSILNNDVVEAKLKEKKKILILDNGNTLESLSVIISTGAQAKWLNVKNESLLKGFGISACATCDGFFYKEKKVAVIGGGNTAAEEALFLTKFASEVFLIHRRDSLRAEKILQERLFKNEKIKVLWNQKVKEFIGDKFLEKILLSNTISNKESIIECEGAFVAIGHSPSTELFKDQVNTDDEGYILTSPDSTKTNIEGVYAAGDVMDKVYRQAITAAGMGCMAALEVEKFLDND